MKIRTVFENTACRQDVQPEHGLSLYIESGRHKLLFDAGQSDKLLYNADAMGIDLTQVDTVILSHGHYDHGGGIPAFLQVNSQAKVYARGNAFVDFYNGTEKYIGLPDTLKHSDRVVKTGDKLEIDQGITLYGCENMPLRFPVESYGLNVKEKGEFAPDPFLHEQYLLMEENGKKILFSGCSHRGILNIVDWFRPNILIGGFHFKNLDPDRDRAVLSSAAETLLQYDTRYYTCHCTGVVQYQYLKTVMGDRLEYLACGSSLEI